MSALIQLSTEVISAHQAGAIPMAAGDGILDWVTSKNTQTQTVLRGVAVTLGIIFVIIQAVASRGAMARICLLYTSPSPRDRTRSRMPSSA